MWSRTKDGHSRSEYTEYRKKYNNHVKKTKKEHCITLQNTLSNSCDAQNTQNAYRLELISANEWEYFLKLLHSQPSVPEVSFSNCGTLFG